MRAILLGVGLTHVVGRQVPEFELRGLHYAATGVEDSNGHRPFRTVLRPGGWCTQYKQARQKHHDGNRKGFRRFAEHRSSFGTHKAINWGWQTFTRLADFVYFIRYLCQPESAPGSENALF